MAKAKKAILTSLLTLHLTGIGLVSSEQKAEATGSEVPVEMVSESRKYANEILSGNRKLQKLLRDQYAFGPYIIFFG